MVSFVICFQWKTFFVVTLIKEIVSAIPRIITFYFFSVLLNFCSFCKQKKIDQKQNKKPLFFFDEKILKSRWPNYHFERPKVLQTCPKIISVCKTQTFHHTNIAEKIQNCRKYHFWTKNSDSWFFTGFLWDQNMFKNIFKVFPK